MGFWVRHITRSNVGTNRFFNVTKTPWTSLLQLGGEPPPDKSRPPHGFWDVVQGHTWTNRFALDLYVPTTMIDVDSKLCRIKDTECVFDKMLDINAYEIFQDEYCPKFWLPCRDKL